MKLHLIARAPNEGARLMARWILGLRGGLTEAAEILDTSPERIERMVAGTMVPGENVLRRLGRAAGIRWGHFQRRPVGWWFDAPALARAA